MSDLDDARKRIFDEQSASPKNEKSGTAKEAPGEHQGRRWMERAASRIAALLRHGISSEDLFT
jgi:hypothetical protein